MVIRASKAIKESKTWPSGPERSLLLLCERLLLSFFALFAFPLSAFASVVITEIMYDTPGSDAGHEWVEITNTGSQQVDLTAYRLFEANTNHKLTIVSGSPFLAPSTSAVIVEDPQLFASDWPGFTGSVLKSTFSLSNTGETVAIKNASSSTEDSVSYASNIGAAGDGGSLHRSSDLFIAALPNPGVFPGEIYAVVKPAPQIVTKSASTKSGVSAAKTTQKKSSSTSSQNVDTAAAVTYTDSQTSSVPKTFPALEWLLGLAALIILGVVAVFFVRAEQGNVVAKEKNSTAADEFDIIDTE
jgi:hypothetical protein